MNITADPINQELFGNFQRKRIKQQPGKDNQSGEISAGNKTLSAKNIDPVNYNEKKKAGFSLPGLLLSTAGTLCAMVLIRKRQGNPKIGETFIEKGLKFIGKYTKNNKTIASAEKVLGHTKKVLNIFKYETGLKEMILLAGGAVSGGLAGGIISDRGKHTKEKVKESMFCFNNIAITTLVVEGMRRAVNMSKHGKSFWAKAGAAVIGIGVGMPTAAFVSNKINNNLIDKNGKKQRELKLEDGLVHIDDIVEAMTLNKVPYVAKVLPFLYTAYGYQAGTKR